MRSARQTWKQFTDILLGPDGRLAHQPDDPGLKNHGSRSVWDAAMNAHERAKRFRRQVEGWRVVALVGWGLFAVSVLSQVLWP